MIRCERCQFEIPGDGDHDPWVCESCLTPAEKAEHERERSKLVAIANLMERTDPIFAASLRERLELIGDYASKTQALRDGIERERKRHSRS